MELGRPDRKTQPTLVHRTAMIGSSGNRRWIIAALLGFGVLVNYFDRVNVSVAEQALHAEFGITTIQFGYLLSAYSWTYALCQLPSGVLLDRFGVRLVGSISSFLWGIATFAAAAATGLTASLRRACCSEW